MHISFTNSEWRLLLFTLGFLFSVHGLTAQEPETEKSTTDLNLLIGDWSITRTYSPGSENERVLEGNPRCEADMDEQFIRCIYDMKRPGKTRALDVVYFNYNAIYDRYESLWLSSTWPIKVLMQGQLEQDNNRWLLKTQAEFLIQNGIMEYVRGELTFDNDTNGFTRQTHIRTSEYEADRWHHHMTERAIKSL